MKKVSLSYAESRYKWGVLLRCTPSRFLQEIDSDLIEHSRMMTFTNNYQNYKGIRDGNPKVKRSQDMSFKGKKDLLSFHNKNTGKKPVIQDHNESSFPFDDPLKIQVGMEVEHPRFGKGKVLNMEGEFPNKKATVFFQSAGQKQLLLKFAMLRILKSI
jgi:DNA helicase-2/ATP-dependent DNA helicase PcrA